jgi:uncharacterized protein (DUF1697 family)
MQTLVSFLRGINMTGHNSLKMNDLAELFRTAGFSEIETYIQSGNVIFSSSEMVSDVEISSKIKEGIHKRFGYNIAVVIRTVPQLELIVKSNPFTIEVSFDPTKTAVIFLSDTPSAAGIEKLKGIETGPDRYAISGKEIYIYCPNGFGKSKLYANFFDKKLNVEGTARNWKTINTILEMAHQRKP